VPRFQLTATPLGLTVVFTMIVASSLYAEGPEPIHHFPLDETQGVTAANGVDGGGDGVYRAEPTLGVEAIYPALGTAVEFAGGTTGQEVLLPHESIGLGGLTHDFTVLAWLRFDELGPTSAIVSGQNATHGWSFMALSNGALRLQTFDGEDRLIGQAFNLSPLGTGIWYQVGVSLDAAGQAKFYVDGDMDRTFPQPLGIPTATDQPFFLAGRGQNFEGASMRGRLADVRIYDRVLSDGDVRSLFAEAVPDAQ